MDVDIRATQLPGITILCNAYMGAGIYLLSGTKKV